MKPKILLAKYLDWAVLAVLAVALLFVAVRSFLLKATGEEKLSEEIRSYDLRVQKGMSDTSAQPQPPRDYLTELRNRFEHPAVMDPYRRNPFLTREDIPYRPLQLRVGMPRSVKFKGTRFTHVVSGEEKPVRVSLAYDLPTGVSTVTFTPVEVGEAAIRIQTDEDLVHLFKISVRSTLKPPPPNPPPADVAVVPRAPVEVRKIKQPAMVLLSFMPNNPTESRTIGFSNNAAVYRKPAGTSDAEYKLLTDPLLVPLNRGQIHEIMLKFQIPEATALQSATSPQAAAAGSKPSGPPEPERATEIRSPNATGTERAVAGEPAPGSFVFLDQFVDDGESYTYKIVTLSTAPDVEPVPCEVPYVSPAPVFVPPLVEFTVRAISADRAAMHLTRRDPDTGQWLSEDVSVAIGMKIGGVFSIKVPQIPGLPPVEPKKVDFSTGCILVGVLPTFEVIEYNKLRLARVDNKYTVIYQAKHLRDPQVLYLTPYGALHFKSKEK